MSHGLKPYSAYKDSGVPWLGRVPEHWAMRSLGSVITPRAERNRPDLPLLSVVREKGVILRSSMADDENHNFIPDDLSNYKVVRQGDLVINKMKAWQGSLGLAPQDGIVSPAYFVFEFPVQVPRFGHALLRSKPYVAFFGRASDGVRVGQWDLSIPGMKRIPVLLPAHEEQSAIVRFLDHADAKIRRYIQAKQRLIKLLEEQRQAIIHRAVTRGLDPNVRLKPSGVPWLGDVPEHWEVRRLRTLVSTIDQGVSPQADGFLAEGDSWGVLKAGCVNRGVFRQTEHKRLARDFEIDPGIIVAVGDVLVSRACGSPELVGSAGRILELKYQLILSDKTFRPRFRDSVDVDFMVYAMNSRYYRTQVEQAISGAEGLANNLPLSSLRDFVFAVPLREEGKRIASWLTEHLGQTASMIARADHKISLLREYRTRLIADVVTGKLDVREAARGLANVADSAQDAEEAEEQEEEPAGVDDAGAHPDNEDRA